MSRTIIRDGFVIKVGDDYKSLCEGLAPVDTVVFGLGLTGKERCIVTVIGTSIVCHISHNDLVRFDFEHCDTYVCTAGGLCLKWGVWLYWKSTLYNVVHFVFHLKFDSLHVEYRGMNLSHVEVRPDYTPVEDEEEASNGR